jgi:fumarate reductase subunit D
MTLIRKLEPIFWMLFGAGGFLASLVLPGLFFMVVIGMPLGLFGDPFTTFVRMSTLFGNPVGKAVLIAVISLVFWHSAHHLRHFAFDIGLHKLQLPLSYGLYGLALAGTIATFAVVGAL